MFDLINAVKQPQLLEIEGIESLGLRESMTLFFGEFSRGIDRKLGALKGSLHPVDYVGVQRYLEKNKVLFVQNVGVEITTPQYFTGSMGEMDTYLANLVNGVFIISNLKTETARLYSWMKDIIRTGRMNTAFNWAITDTDEALQQAEAFLKDLPDPRVERFPLDQVYLQFNDAFKLMNQYNQVVKSIKSRDIEIVTRDITAVYELGNLLVKKIEANDMNLEKNTLVDIQFVINNYIGLVNLSGAMAGLLNELSAVFNAQLNEFKKMK